MNMRATATDKHLTHNGVSAASSWGPHTEALARIGLAITSLVKFQDVMRNATLERRGMKKGMSCGTAAVLEIISSPWSPPADLLLTQDKRR